MYTRVNNPYLHELKTMGKTIKYIQGSKELVPTLEADSISILKYYANASFTIHSHMKIHTRGMFTMGKGCVYGSSNQQRLNTKISTEAKVVGVSDILPQIIWTRKLFKGQGYDMDKSVIYQ